TEEVFKGDKGEILEGLASKPDPGKEFAAGFADGYVLLGKTENMRAGLEALRQSAAENRRELQQSAQKSSAPIVTYAHDGAGLYNFSSTLLTLQGRQLSNDEVANLENV